MPELSVTLAAPSDKELLAEAEGQFADAITLTVESAEDYSTADLILKEIKGQYKALDKQRREIKRPFDDGIKRLQDMFRPVLTYLAQAEGHLKQQMIWYQEEQKNIHRQEVAKAQEAARKEREKLEAQAAKAREKGREERAQALEQRADETLAAPVAIETPKAENTSTRTTYSAEVFDIEALIAAVATGKVPREALTANQKFLNQMARALKKNMAYPGVRVVESKTMGVSA